MDGFFLLLFIALCLTFQPHLSARTEVADVPSVTPSSTEDLVAKACELAEHKGYCMTLLKSDRNYNKTKLKGLAFIAFKVAERNATETSLFIKNLLRNSSLEPGEQQGLSDCSEHYISAVDLIDDAINSLVSDAYADIPTWVNAAVTDIDSCAASINEWNGDVARMNYDIRNIFTNALSVARVLGPH